MRAPNVLAKPHFDPVVDSVARKDRALNDAAGNAVVRSRDAIDGVAWAGTHRDGLTAGRDTGFVHDGDFAAGTDGLGWRQCDGHGRRGLTGSGDDNVAHAGHGKGQVRAGEERGITVADFAMVAVGSPGTELEFAL